MSELAYFVVIGLCLGCGYALAALGIATLFNGTGVLNFAQGEFIMISALFVALRTSEGHGYVLAAIEAAGIATLIGLVVGLLFIRPALSASRDIDLTVLGTVGVSIVLANLAGVFLGEDTYSLQSPVSDMRVSFGGYRISYDYFVLIAVSLIAFIALMVLYHRTDIGLQMRAMSADVDAARLSGIAVGRLTVIGWIIAAVIGSLTGVLLGAVLLVSSAMGIALTISAFAAAMIGGLKSPWGALLGGVIIGLAETFAAGYLGTAARQSISPLVIIVVLLLVPGGILSARKFQTRTV